MGKPYTYEIEWLERTYAWARTEPINRLANAILDSAFLPLLTTGSGGSLTAAHFASYLHQSYAEKPAKAVTPLEIVSSGLNTRDLTVMFLSAGGNNSDIIGAFQTLVAREPYRLIAICLRKESTLSRIAQAYQYVDLIEFDLPCGKDGFLATNSLLAFLILLCRAWQESFNESWALPQNLKDLVYPRSTREEFIETLSDRCSPLWQRDTMSVLYGPSAHCAAFDLESKFTEAALGTVQIADYRNFAHGRHHWLAKRGNSTGILALVTDDDQHIANKTLMSGHIL